MRWGNVCSFYHMRSFCNCAHRTSSTVCKESQRTMYVYAGVQTGVQTLMFFEEMTYLQYFWGYVK